MNQSQYLMLKHFIQKAFDDINRHKECRDHASQRVMMYAYGRVVGAYAMRNNGDLGADVHEKVQLLEECYNDAMGLTLLCR